MTRFSTDIRSNTDHDLFKGMTKKKKDKDRKQEAPPAILVGEHSRYLIKSGQLAGTFVARAFPKPPTTARGLIAEATGATEEAAIAALHEAIDARESRRTGERREDPKTGLSVPSTEEYVEAICQVTLSRPQCAMLTALSLAGEDGLTGVKMAKAAGYKSQASANRSLVSAGQLIADYLSLETRAQAASGDPDSTSLLGFRGEPQDDDAPGNWILHPELRKAVRLAL